MWGATLDSVVVESCGRGIVLDHTQATTLINCISRLNKGDPFYATTSSTITILGGAYENSYAGHGASASVALNFDSCYSVSVTGTYLENTIDALIKLVSTSYSTFSSVFVNNTTGVGSMIKLEGSEHNVFSGLRIEGIDASGNYGINIDATSNYNMFLGIEIETDGSSAGGSTPVSDSGTDNIFLNVRFGSTFYDKLKVHGALSTTSTLAVTGNVGFYGTAPGAKPTITGSKGANAALADLITKLAALGLLTDSTS